MGKIIKLLPIFLFAILAAFLKPPITYAYTGIQVASGWNGSTTDAYFTVSYPNPDDTYVYQPYSGPFPDDSVPAGGGLGPCDSFSNGICTFVLHWGTLVGFSNLWVGLGQFGSGTYPYYFLPLSDFVNETRFFTINVSTSTRIVTTTGYIAPSDIASNTIKYTMNVATPVYPTWDSQFLVATTSGLFSYSFEYGGSFASTTIEQFTFTGTLGYDVGNIFSDIGAFRTLDTISTTTFPGSAISDFTPAQIEQAIADNCIPWSSFWSLGLCVSYLVYPSSSQVDQNIQHVRDTILSKAPIGYVVRMIDIINSSSTAPFPTISYTFPSMNGPLDGENIHFNLNTIMTQSAAIIAEAKSNGSNPLTAWEIFGDFIKLFLAIILVYGMIHDITGLHLIHHKH